MMSLARYFALFGMLVWLGGCGADDSATDAQSKASGADATASHRPTKLTIGVSSMGTAEA